MPAIKMKIGGTESSVTLYPIKSSLPYKSVKIVINAVDYYAPISENLENALMTKMRVRVGGNTYGFLSKVNQADTIVLTDDHYKMSDLYPDTYETMTSIPDNLDVSRLTTMREMFAGCVKLQSVPAFNTSKITTFHDAFKECNALGSGDFPWSIDVRSVTGYKENYWPFQMFTYEHSENQPHFSKVRFINTTIDQKNYLIQDNKPQTYVWMDKYSTQSVEISFQEENPYGYVIYGSGEGKTSGEQQPDTPVEPSIDWEGIASNAQETKKLVIPDGVTKIPDHAFESKTFMVEEVQVPDSLEEIGDYAFYGVSWSNLKKQVVFTNVKKIGKRSFGMPKTSPTAKDLAMDYVTNYGSYKYKTPGLAWKKGSTLVFPCIQSVGEEAFYYCMLSEIRLGSQTNHSVSEIGKDAFKYVHSACYWYDKRVGGIWTAYYYFTNTSILYYTDVSKVSGNYGANIVAFKMSDSNRIKDGCSYYDQNYDDYNGAYLYRNSSTLSYSFSN